MRVNTLITLGLVGLSCVSGCREDTATPKADQPSTSGPPKPAVITIDTRQVNPQGRLAGVRIVMQVTIDEQGNRWGVDRGMPSRLVKLDPRSGEMRTWDLPDSRAGVHDMTQDRQGRIWVLEFTRTENGQIDSSGAGSELSSRKRRMPSMPLSAPLLSWNGKARGTRPTAHFWNSSRSCRASASASAAVVGSPMTS